MQTTTAPTIAVPPRPVGLTGAVPCAHCRMIVRLRIGDPFQRDGAGNMRYAAGHVASDPARGPLVVHCADCVKRLGV